MCGVSPEHLGPILFFDSHPKDLQVPNHILAGYLSTKGDGCSLLELSLYQSVSLVRSFPLAALIYTPPGKLSLSLHLGSLT